MAYLTFQFDISLGTVSGAHLTYNVDNLVLRKINWWLGRRAAFNLEHITLKQTNVYALIHMLYKNVIRKNNLKMYPIVLFNFIAIIQYNIY